MGLSLGCIAPHLIGLSTIVEGVPRLGTEGKKNEFEACFVNRPFKQNSGVSHKMLLEGEETGKFHEQ